MHLPLRTFERMATGQILERTRQLESIRQFFASQMPLLLVDLAFVGVFVAVLCYLDFRLGAITLAAMPLFWLLSLLARHRHRRLIEAGFRAAAAKASSLGETISQAARAALTHSSHAWKATRAARAATAMITPTACAFQAGAGWLA